MLGALGTLLDLVPPNPFLFFFFFAFLRARYFWTLFFCFVPLFLSLGPNFSCPLTPHVAENGHKNKWTRKGVRENDTIT